MAAADLLRILPTRKRRELCCWKRLLQDTGTNNSRLWLCALYCRGQLREAIVEPFRQETLNEILRKA